MADTAFPAGPTLVSNMNDLSKDELFRILSSSRRRYIIYFLHEAEGEVSLGDLATRIAAKENDRPPEDVTDSERQRVYISLYQTHLPKLEESGIVEYDEDERLVSMTPEMRQEGFFWMRSAEPTPWEQYYAGLGAAGWFAILLVYFQLVPLLSWPLVAVLLTVGLSVLVALQYTAEPTVSTEDDAFEALIE